MSEKKYVLETLAWIFLHGIEKKTFYTYMSKVNSNNLRECFFYV